MKTFDRYVKATAVVVLLGIGVVYNSRTELSRIANNESIPALAQLDYQLHQMNAPFGVVGATTTFIVKVIKYISLI